MKELENIKAAQVERIKQSQAFALASAEAAQARLDGDDECRKRADNARTSAAIARHHAEVALLKEVKQLLDAFELASDYDIDRLKGIKLDD